jgi:hypothetical protein
MCAIHHKVLTMRPPVFHISVRFQASARRIGPPGSRDIRDTQSASPARTCSGHPDDEDWSRRQVEDFGGGTGALRRLCGRRESVVIDIREHNPNFTEK